MQTTMELLLAGVDDLTLSLVNTARRFFRMEAARNYWMDTFGEQDFAKVASFDHQQVSNASWRPTKVMSSRRRVHCTSLVVAILHAARPNAQDLSNSTWESARAGVAELLITHAALHEAPE